MFEESVLCGSEGVLKAILRKICINRISQMYSGVDEIFKQYKNKTIEKEGKATNLARNK